MMRYKPHAFKMIEMINDLNHVGCGHGMQFGLFVLCSVFSLSYTLCSWNRPIISIQIVDKLQVKMRTVKSAADITLLCGACSCCGHNPEMCTGRAEQCQCEHRHSIRYEMHRTLC